MAMRLISIPFHGKNAAKEPKPMYEASVNPQVAQPANNMPNAEAIEVVPISFFWLLELISAREYSSATLIPNNIDKMTITKLCKFAAPSPILVDMKSILLSEKMTRPKMNAHASANKDKRTLENTSRK